jgi:hypothetical protein
MQSKKGQGQEAAIRAEIEAMRVGEIESELVSKGVSTQGLLEKSDFVKLLVQTRLTSLERATSMYVHDSAAKMSKTITLEVDLNQGVRKIFLEVEDSDDIHVVKNKIEDKIGSRGDPADRRLIFNGKELEDGSTLANNNIKNKSIISMQKHRIVFGMKWVDVGDKVPKSLTEIKWPDLEALVSEGLKIQGVGKGVVDLAQDAFREKASEILTLEDRILWLDMGRTQPNQGRELKNPTLSDALKLKKEFTSQELTTFELTGQDLTKFGIQDFCMTDYVKVGSSYFQPAPGLSFSRMPIWQKHDTKPKKGRELNNQELKDHSINAFLATVTSDDNLRAGQELTTLGIQDLLMDDYIKNYGGGYFQAKTLTENHCIKVGSRYDGRMT